MSSGEFHEPISFLERRRKHQENRLQKARIIFDTLQKRYEDDVLGQPMAFYQVNEITEHISSELNLKNPTISRAKTGSILSLLREKGDKTVILRSGNDEACAFGTGFLLSLLQERDLRNRGTKSLIVKQLDENSFTTADAIRYVIDAQNRKKRDAAQIITGTVSVLIADTTQAHEAFTDSRELTTLYPFGMIIRIGAGIVFPNGFFS